MIPATQVAGGAPGRAARAAFAALLATAMALGSSGGFIIGTLAPFIVVDLGLSRSALGLLATSVFATSTIASPVAGKVVDVLGGRVMLMGVFASAGAALLAMALAPTYSWLLVATATSGIAMAIMNPATNALISTHIPRGAQGIILGVKQSGVQLALFATGLILPSVALLAGWRAALALSALPAAVGLIAVLGIVPASPAPSRATSGTRSVLDATVTHLTAYAFLMGFASAAVTTYLVLFAVESVGLSARTAGLAGALLGLTGVISRVAWATRVERMNSAAAPLSRMAFAGFVCIGLVLAAPAVGPWLLWVAAGMFGATASAWNAVGNLVLVRELPLAVAGRASGIMQVGFYGGYMASPPVFGYLADTTGGYGVSWLSAMATLAAAVAIAWHWEWREKGGRSA